MIQHLIVLIVLASFLTLKSSQQQTTVSTTTLVTPRSLFVDLWYVPLILAFVCIGFLTFVFVMRRYVFNPQNIYKSKKYLNRNKNNNDNGEKRPIETVNLDDIVLDETKKIRTLPPPPLQASNRQTTTANIYNNNNNNYNDDSSRMTTAAISPQLRVLRQQETRRSGVNYNNENIIYMANRQLNGRENDSFEMENISNRQQQFIYENQMITSNDRRHQVIQIERF